MPLGRRRAREARPGRRTRWRHPNEVRGEPRARTEEPGTARCRAAEICRWCGRPRVSLHRTCCGLAADCGQVSERIPRERGTLPLQREHGPRWDWRILGHLSPSPGTPRADRTGAAGPAVDSALWTHASVSGKKENSGLTWVLERGAPPAR
ncbi:hypothetical protein NDU88_005387 [Pleurodeles waltl]|uniref:Uncharacterized protein n=1 Tax=Pleurodeles waltl TaxID=8319 RepID=A0AAV7W7P0_PLEWA|nr:hypothetical protein NDU88_005387 [Pleurodeles waltl]